MKEVICTLVVLCLFCTSCSTITYTQQSEIGKSSFNAKPGDKIVLYLNDGEIKKVVFKKIDHKTLYYLWKKSGFYIEGKSDFKDIEKVRIKRMSGKKTTLVVIGGFFGGVAAIALAMSLFMY